MIAIQKRAPLVFVLVGIAGAVLANLMLFSNDSGRTSIELGVVLAFSGGALGMMAGSATRILKPESRTARCLTALSIVLLTVMLGIILGWQVGDIRTQFERERRELVHRTSLIGAGIGLIVGIVIVLLQPSSKTTT